MVVHALYFYFMADALALPFSSINGVSSGAYTIVDIFDLRESESHLISISYDIGCVIGGASSIYAFVCPVYFLPYSNSEKAMYLPCFSNTNTKSQLAFYIRDGEIRGYGIGGLILSFMLFKAPST